MVFIITGKGTVEAIEKILCEHVHRFKQESEALGKSHSEIANLIEECSKCMVKICGIRISEASLGAKLNQMDELCARIGKQIVCIKAVCKENKDNDQLNVVSNTVDALQYFF